MCIDGNHVLSTEEIQNLFLDQEGLPQNALALDYAIARLERVYRIKGYADARVVDVTVDAAGELHVRIDEEVPTPLNRLSDLSDCCDVVDHAFRVEQKPKPWILVNSDESGAAGISNSAVVRPFWKNVANYSTEVSFFGTQIPTWLDTQTWWYASGNRTGLPFTYYPKGWYRITRYAQHSYEDRFGSWRRYPKTASNFPLPTDLFDHLYLQGTPPEKLPPVVLPSDLVNYDRPHCL